MSQGPGKRRLDDRYELDEHLGSGGMVDVYRARDHVLGRVVAIKLLKPELAADEMFRDRFKREAELGVRLNHPSIVAVYTIGEDVDPTRPDTVQPYMVVEYVDGPSLRDLIREQHTLPPERALPLVRGVCQALAPAHKLGIVHRDIKPSKVMVTSDGEIKVSDFGIAALMSEATPTTTAEVIGTAQYLSPEQARGDIVDGRSDIYSVGCLLYELLTGRPPFVGDSPVAVAYQHVRDVALPPSVYNEDLDAELDGIVLTCLAKSPEDRYQTVAALDQQIERYLSGEEVVSAGSDPQEPTPSPVLRETSHALSLVDAISDTDAIGRGALVDHLADVIVRMVNGSRQDLTSAATLVLGVDAPWGAGKTTVMHLLERQLTSRSRPADQPVVIPFDAWRESKVGPEWWSLGGALYRGVRRERAWAAQVAMVVGSATSRLVRSKAFLGASILLALLVVLVADPHNAVLIATWQSVITTVAAAIAAAFGLSRLLFWSSPALGSLYQKSEDAALAEIAAMIARHRRWSPRSTSSQRLADTALGVWSALVVAAVLVPAWVNRPTPVSNWVLLVAGALAVVGAVVYACYVIMTLSDPKRPIILVLDDLDRCSDVKTVAYLETIHTLIRHHEQPRFLTRWRWPAPLVIIVLADGRWVRHAFAKAYETFAEVSVDQTRGLGADFIQKLFDHTVMVPELTVPQAAEYVRQLTGSDVVDDVTGNPEPIPPVEAARVKPSPEAADDPTEAARGIVAAAAAAHLDQLERSASRYPRAEAEALREAIADERSSDRYVLELTRHLMTKYSAHMPQNPRMIKRVANAWSMLQAVQRSIGSEKTERELVAAAIFVTKFPNLVDVLLHDPTMPQDAGLWRRPDVVDTRCLGQEPVPSLADLAWCYGRMLRLPET